MGISGLVHPIDVVYESCLYPFRSDVVEYLEIFREVSPYIENDFYAFYGQDEEVREELVKLRDLFLKWIECPETDYPAYYAAFTLVIPKRRRVIQKHEFTRCEEPSSVEMPDSVSVIRRSAFWGCHRLEKVRFSKRLKTIEKSAFGDCHLLSGITFPEHLESIGAAAFFNCGRLEDVVIPKSVRHIGKHAFGMCRRLKHVLLPKDTVTDKAFYECHQCEIEYY